MYVTDDKKVYQIGALISENVLLQFFTKNDRIIHSFYQQIHEFDSTLNEKITYNVMLNHLKMCNAVR